MAIFIHPPSIPYTVVSEPPRRRAKGGGTFMRLPINTLPVIRLTFTDQLRFIGRQRVSSGYLATGLSRR